MLRASGQTPPACKAAPKHSMYSPMAATARSRASVRRSGSRATSLGPAANNASASALPAAAGSPVLLLPLVPLPIPAAAHTASTVASTPAAAPPAPAATAASTAAAVEAAPRFRGAGCN